MDREKAMEGNSHQVTCSPHGEIFRRFMADLSVAREFLTHYLPETVRCSVDLSQLALCPGSYVDEELALTMSDVLYKTHIAGKDGYVYILAVHRGTENELIPLYVRQNMISIWLDHQEQTQGGKLPSIIPVVFYHAREPYSAGCDLRDVIGTQTELVDVALPQSCFVECSEE